MKFTLPYWRKKETDVTPYAEVQLTDKPFYMYGFTAVTHMKPEITYKEDVYLYGFDIPAVVEFRGMQGERAYLRVYDNVVDDLMARIDFEKPYVIYSTPAHASWNSKVWISNYTLWIESSGKAE